MALPHITLPDGRQVKLGRKSPDPEKLKTVVKLRDHLNLGDIPVLPPNSADFVTKAMAAINQMYGNGTVGNCVICDFFHSLGIWTGNEIGTPVIGTTAEAISAYHTICGPGDEGCIITDVLDYATKTGIVVGGKLYKIAGYAAIDWTNQTEVQIGILGFGALTIGVNLPVGWYNNPHVWDVVTGADAQIDGGHCIPGGAYVTPPFTSVLGINAVGVVIATWAGIRVITWPAFLSRNWLMECYVVLSPNWTDNAGLDPLGVNVATLQQDLADYAAGIMPPVPIGPGPTPPPPTPPPTPVPPTPTPTPPTPPTPTPTPPVTTTMVGFEPGAKIVYAPANLGIKFQRVAGHLVTLSMATKEIGLPGSWTDQRESPPTTVPVILFDLGSKVAYSPEGFGINFVHSAPGTDVKFDEGAKRIWLPGKWTGQQI